MPFRFRLYDPPCDATSLSLVDTEALYNADGTSTRDIKEVTIREMGWHPVQLPKDWFRSHQALDTTRQLLEAMQCTIQYLKHCRKSEERRVQQVTAQLRRCEEERAAAFEALIELRETVALYKQQSRDVGPVQQRARSPPSRATLSRERHMVRSRGTESTTTQQACSFCANVYPSWRALDSHIRKRHKRSEGCVVMSATSAPLSLEVQKQQEHHKATTRAPTLAHQTPSDSLFVGNTPPVLHEAGRKWDDCSLREEISELRMSMAKLIEQQAMLYRGLSPSYVAAVPQQSADEAATAAAVVASTGPLPDLQQHGSGSHEEEDILLRIQRDLLRTGTQLQQLQRAFESESAARGCGATDARGTLNLRDDLSQSEQRRQQLDSLKVPLGVRAVQELNPQNILHPPSLTESGHNAGAVRRRESVGDSLVIVSPITPLGAVTAMSHHALGSQEGTTPALAQKHVRAATCTVSESLHSNLSGPCSPSETQRPTGAVGTTLPSPLSALGIHVSSSGGDSAAAAAAAVRRHENLIPQSTFHFSPSDSSVNAGNQSASREPETPTPLLPSSSFRGHLPWIVPDSATARIGTADAVSANRYGSAPRVEATSWESGGLLLGAKLEVPEQRKEFSTSTRQDAMPSPNVTAAGREVNSKSGLVTATSTGAPQRCDIMRSSEAISPGEPCGRSSSTMQLLQVGVDTVHFAPSQLKVTQDKGQSGTHVPPREKSPPVTQTALTPAPNISGSVPSLGSTVADADRLQYLHAEAHGCIATGAGVAKCSSVGNVGESPPSRPRVPTVRVEESLVSTEQPACYSARKVIPVVHLVPEAPSELGNVLPQDPEKQRQEPMHGDALSPSAVSLPPMLGLDGHFQHRMLPQEPQRRGGKEEDSRERKTDSKEAYSYSVEMQPLEALTQDDAVDGLFSTRFDATMEEGSNMGDDGLGGLVMEDVSYDELADAAPHAAEKVRSAQLSTFGDAGVDGKVEVHRVTSCSFPGPTEGGKQTPSQADSPSVESVSEDYSYYTYSYSYSDDKEEAIVASQETNAVEICIDDVRQKNTQASSISEGAAVGRSGLPFRADVTPAAHHTEELKFGTVKAQRQDVRTASTERLKKSDQSVKGNASQPTNQQEAPSRGQRAPANVKRGGVQVSDEIATVPLRKFSSLFAPKSQQVLKKPKGLFTRLFSKKGK
ncbi:hypothetical protein MNV84_05986 [Leishmania braziliensis]|nr:hypothetical protein MNV84_05986 [Leishmania braziliensis]